MIEVSHMWTHCQMWTLDSVQWSVPIWQVLLYRNTWDNFLTNRLISRHPVQYPEIWTKAWTLGPICTQLHQYSDIWSHMQTPGLTSRYIGQCLNGIEWSLYTLIALETGSFTVLNTELEDILVIKIVGYIHQVHTVASKLQFILKISIYSFKVTSNENMHTYSSMCIVVVHSDVHLSSSVPSVSPLFFPFLFIY